MGPIREFNRQNILLMMEYLRAVSTAKNGLYSNPRLSSRGDRYILTNLERHKVTLSTLERESVSEPPHYIDSSRELAIITSAMVRHSQDVNKGRARKLDDAPLKRLCDACFKVEAETLQRVNELATRLAQERGRASASTTSAKQLPRLPRSLSLGSIAVPKFPQPLVADAPFAALGPHPQSVGKSEEGSTSWLRAPSHASGEKPDVISSDIGVNGVTKLGKSESLSEVDDIAKRKKSFMRGFFGGL